MTVPAWREGSKLVHPFNPELGVGFVRRVEGRYLVVYFPAVEREVTMAAQGAGLTPLILPPGSSAIELENGTEVRIERWDGDAIVLADGRRIEDKDIWPLERAPARSSGSRSSGSTGSARSATGSKACSCASSARRAGWAASSAAGSPSSRTSSTPRSPR